MAETTPTCDYCLGPIRGRGLSGRRRPDQSAGRYCCFGCLSLGEQRPSASLPLSKRINGLALRIAIAVLLSGQSMILSLGIVMEPSTTREDKLLVYGGILLGTLIVFGLLGVSLVRSALQELRAGFITIESLFLLTMGGAFAASMQSFITGNGPVYFEVVSVILVIYSIGKAIMARAKQSAIGGTIAWADSLSTCRKLETDGNVREVPVTEIQPGDLVEVLPGELFPVDGQIERGGGFVSTAAMTGEPFAVVKLVGDSILAGCVSHDSLFVVKATVAGTARQVDHLLEAVEQARLKPGSGQELVDRISARVFVLLIFISLVTCIYWWYSANLQTGIFYAMSVLLVACPCALGLATPLVIWVALARLAEWGFVVRAGDVVERLPDIDRVVFDKTGTLTEERFSLANIEVSEDSPVPRSQLLNWIAAVQSRSPHPMAGAFAELATPELAVHVVEVHTIPGCGVEAVVQSEGNHRLRIGRPDWISSEATAPAQFTKNPSEFDGHRIDCEIDGRLAAIAIVQERLRESVPQACEQLKALGVDVSVLTGDTAQRAAITGVSDVRAGLLPDDKTALIKRWREEGRHVLMVGDGSNDAGALATADVGIAMATGTDLATRAADVTLYHADLRVIPWAIALGRKAKRIIRRNLWVAAIYNLIGVVFAVTGNLHPILAVIVMVFSSLFVIWSSTRVAVSAELDCHDPPGEATVDGGVPISKTLSHAFSLILQGMLISLFFGFSRGTGLAVAVGFAVIGIASAIYWSRAKTLIHSFDMTYGMLTLGNLGMILGWYADAGFAPLSRGDCECAEAIFNGVLKPWMWLGMWVGSTVAMLALERTPHGSPTHRWSMLTGGNLGMGIGMLLGGWLAARVSVGTISAGAMGSLAGMTIGMIMGMFAGTALTEQSLRLIKRIRRKLRANP